MAPILPLNTAEGQPARSNAALHLELDRLWNFGGGAYRENTKEAPQKTPSRASRKSRRVDRACQIIVIILRTVD